MAKDSKSYRPYVQEEKLNRCYGCAIQHPNQRRHSCLMTDKDDSWLYYREDVNTLESYNYIDVYLI